MVEWKFLKSSKSEELSKWNCSKKVVKQMAKGESKKIKKFKLPIPVTPRAKHSEPISRSQRNITMKPAVGSSELLNSEKFLRRRYFSHSTTTQ